MDRIFHYIVFLVLSLEFVSRFAQIHFELNGLLTPFGSTNLSDRTGLQRGAIYWAVTSRASLAIATTGFL